MNMHYKQQLMISAFCIFFSSALNAAILYKNHDDADYDYNEVSISDLQVGACKKDQKAMYILALHKIHNKNEKVEGVQLLERLAREGVTDAKHSLYAISSWVNVSDLSPEKALNYLKEAAEEGYAVSQLDLAKAYIRGKLGKRNPEMSHYWLVKSAEQNNEDALRYVANDYYVGRGVPKDDAKGFEWLMVAYNKLGGRFNNWGWLGQAYEEGAGTAVDLTRAYMCYDMEGSAGIEKKARIAPHMTVAQQAEGLRLSQEWQKKYHSYTMQSLGLKRHSDGSYN